MKNTENRTIAIVTGGGSGIGLAIAKTFVENKIFTIIIGRNQEKLDEAQRQLGENCAAIPFDLTELARIPQLIADVIKKFGHIDILVNNAGINFKKEFTEVSDEDFSRIIHTNVSSVFSISREVAKHMIERKKGAILNISSMAALYGIPKVIAYTASKAAIEGMTKAMAVELSPLGIRVNSIAPGFIATEMSSKALNNDPERKNKVLSRTPMGYLGETADIGEAALFLTSKVAKYITGTCLPVDGGNSIGF